MNTWKKLINNINRYKAGSVITRKRLMEVNSSSLFWNPSFNDEPTIDVYRRYLTVAGFLRHIGRGKYTRVSHIPKNISKRDVQKMGYNTDKYYKGW